MYIFAKEINQPDHTEESQPQPGKPLRTTEHSMGTYSPVTARQSLNLVHVPVQNLWKKLHSAKIRQIVTKEIPKENKI